MSDYRSSEDYYSDECSKCNHKHCNKKVKYRRSCTPEKCSSYDDCECYTESRCCESSRKCKCRNECPRNEHKKKECENKSCNCSNKICKKKDKYEVCDKLKMFEDTLINAKNEKIFFITIG